MSISTPNTEPSPTPPNLIHLDGKTLEGGGQLLRLALSLSSLTGRGIHVTDIRGNRAPGRGRGSRKAGGLKTSHYECARFLAALTGASTEGLEVGSSELIFRPRLDRVLDIDVVIDVLRMQQSQAAEQKAKGVADKDGGGAAGRGEGGKKGQGKGAGKNKGRKGTAAPPVAEEQKATPSLPSPSTPESLLLAAANGSLPTDELLPSEYRHSSLDGPDIDPNRPRCITIRQKTPGAVFLVMQALLPYLLFGPFSRPRPQSNTTPTTSTTSPIPPAQESQPPLPPPEIQLSITGGTNVSSSPSFEYIQQVLLPTLSHLVGIPSISANLFQRGWSSPPSGSSGGGGGGGSGNQLGTVDLRIQPLAANTPLPAFDIFRAPGHESAEQYTLKQIDVSVLANPPALLHELQDELVAELDHRFRDAGLNGSPVPVHIKLLEDSRRRNRVYVLAVARIGQPELASPDPDPGDSSAEHSRPPSRQEEYLLGRDVLLDGSDRTEMRVRDLAKRLARELKDDVDSGRLVDEHMQDQLVVFQALAAGRSTVDAGPRVEPSLHTRTARWVAEKILVGLEFDGGGGLEEAVEGMNVGNGGRAAGGGGGDRGRSCRGVAFVPGSHPADGFV